MPFPPPAARCSGSFTMPAPHEFFVMVDGGMVFASTSASGNHFTVFGLQARPTGTWLWQYTTPSFFPGLLGAVNGIVYTAGATNPGPSASNSTLTALDAASGRVLWQQPVQPGDGVVAGPPVESNGLLYAETSTGAVYALQPANGHVLWHVSVSSQWGTAAGAGRTQSFIPDRSQWNGLFGE